VTAGDLETGARIGRYVIIEKVGTGAMGVVYGAYDPELDRKIALKLIRPGHGIKDTAQARLLREAKAIARLAHPNVVAVHDAGVLEDQVFLAMEFVSGGTIKSWLADKPRSWREVLDVFIAAGRGLVAAHAAGLVHRDFKPDNVLIDREERPRVVDFGIARQAGAADEESAAAEHEAAARTLQEHTHESSGNVAPLLTLTKTGTMVGTPAYMAPEQFLGERGDERSDQFSFCVALYEALYGQRPFAGHDFLSISVNVTTEQLRPLPKDRDVPAWIRRLILRGLKADPEARWESMAALIRALGDDPDIKLRRRFIVGGTIAVGAVSLLIAWQMVSRRRAEADREIGRQVAAAAHDAGTARAAATKALELRKRSFAAFDALNRDEGETSWKQARALLPAIDAGYDQAERAFESAFTLDPSRVEIRAQLADLRYEHLLFAEDFRMEAKAQVLQERLASADANGSRRKALAAPGTLALSVTPPTAHVVLERYDRDAITGRRTTAQVGPLAAHATTTLPAGSYRLVIEGAGLSRILYPFEIRRAQRAAVDIELPRAGAIPEGFVYVPASEFWFGDGDEQLRTQFLNTVPIHKRQMGPYLIAERETTFGEWIEYLNAQPPADRARRLPGASMPLRGSLALRDGPGGWQLTIQPTSHRYLARAGEKLAYKGRTQRVREDWLRFPVTGISGADMELYLAWLRSSGRVRNARFCTEVEWEHAARGADDRVFPHGDDLQPDDANFDLTYGRIASAYGPDAVSSHPASRSPFGVDDLAGNVMELIVSSQQRDEMVIRGGGYWFGAASCRSTNREPVPSTIKDVATGLRVCASL
jgi:formylglycine-generating enzyme required for sulfatase activity/tRNA A-37 threonylcarbamoyl transferase component Bud32